ncbi:lysophospholipid acyltransferase family protein [Phormidesmis sp. 146-12]
MASDSPLQISRLLLLTLGMQMYLHHRDRVPQDSALLVVSNHRSFLDAPLLMAAIDRPIRFACHHYMGQVPVMREIVTKLGCFPLEAPEQRQQSFFHQATQLLKTQQAVGVFPEGTDPMVNSPDRTQMGDFQRGFAHLALRAPVQNLAVLPVAIAVQSETKTSAVPLKLLSFFDPSEPLFNQEGWHPLVMYQRVNVMIGRPYWIQPAQRQHYQGKQARTIVNDLTHHCHDEIKDLLHQGCF